MAGPIKYLNLYNQLKDNIVLGNYPYDEPMPSIRQLASELALSRTTIENAYGQLLLEGYVYSVQGVGYYPNILVKTHHLEMVNKDKGNTVEEGKNKSIIYDFSNEYADPKAMDVRIFKKHLNTVFTKYCESLLEPLHQAGEPELRDEIAEYIRMARGIEVTGNDIIIGAGIQTLLGNLITVMANDMDGFAIENPGFTKIRETFVKRGIKVTPISLTDEGVHMTELNRCFRYLCYVSPAHQFPTGRVMQVKNRYELIRWAEDNESYIIEDDYNAELRYDLFPVASLKSLDHNDRVIYLGSFSTYMVPGIRISYMILPEKLKQEYMDCGFSQTAAKSEQLAFAEMLRSRDYLRHIQKIRKYYSKKTKLVHKLLAEILSEEYEVIRTHSGLSVMIKAPKFMSEISIEAVMKGEGISITTTNDYLMSGQLSETLPIMLFLNYKGISEELMEAGITRFAEILNTYACDGKSAMLL